MLLERNREYITQRSRSSYQAITDLSRVSCCLIRRSTLYFWYISSKMSLVTMVSVQNKRIAVINTIKPGMWTWGLLQIFELPIRLEIPFFTSTVWKRGMAILIVLSIFAWNTLNLTLVNIKWWSFCNSKSSSWSLVNRELPWSSLCFNSLGTQNLSSLHTLCTTLHVLWGMECRMWVGVL